MPINFPDAPNTNDQFTSGGKTWLYTGNTWELVARETGIPNNSITSGMLLANAAIRPTIVDAKGDLVTASADNTPARLPVGADGLFLRANSTTALGVNWEAIPIVSSLDDIGNVNVSSVSTGQIIRWNGATWVSDNETPDVHDSDQAILGSQIFS